MRKTKVVQHFWLFVSFCLITGPSFGSERIALVIGNSHYHHNASLKNPGNDARAVSEGLSDVGFEVTVKLDLTGADMRRELAIFAEKAINATDALIFYAGHGIEVSGENYLVPVDAKLETDTSVSFEAIPLKLLSQAVSSASGIKMIILDACRDNPFADDMVRRLQTRTVGRGLAPIEPTKGVLIAYSAEGGSVAQDGEGKNSPFATSLLNKIRQPGLEIGWLFREITSEVLRATDERQRPFLYGSLPSEPIYFLPPTHKEIIKPKFEVETETEAEAEKAWNAISRSDSPAMIKIFIKLYPDTLYTAFAKARLQELEGLAQQAPSVEERFNEAVAAREKQKSLKRRAEEFIKHKFLGSSRTDRAHYEEVYADRVDFHGTSNASLEFVVNDKQAYFRRWPNFDYVYRSGEFEILSSAEPMLISARIIMSFYVENSKKRVQGVVEGSYMLRGQDNGFRIISESSRIIDSNSIEF